MLLCVILLTTLQTFSQTTSISGKISDTLNKLNLSNASISIIRAKDSILLAFTRSNADGFFTINNISEGKYFIQISNPNYADYLDAIVVDKNNISLGNITLLTKTKLLEEVVVKQKMAAIRMKGDTTEYRADSFRVGANSNVQELLKKLPGITVNSKGEITAQGQTVKKVLVDGEEFFSDDPAVVTQNLRADAIDKVQVFDKKSDQANFTGIDDGEKNKTINLQLKDDKKKGYFGKIEAGSDFDKYSSGKVLVNAFKAKSKVAAYITHDNTKFESLNWEEKRSYGEDLNSNVEINDDGGMMMWSNGDAFSWGEGLPTNTTAGLHYSQKWNKDKNNIINTYQYNNLGVVGNINTITKTLLDSTYTTGNTTQIFDNQKDRNRLKTTYEWTIDSTSSLKTSITESIVKGNNNNSFSGNTSNAKNELINETNRTTATNERAATLLSTIFWRKKFKKKGRTISLNTDLDFNNDNSTGYYNSKNTFYSSSLGVVEFIDQYKTNTENKFAVTSKAVYTEPLWKNTFLQLNYKFQNNKNDAERITYDKTPFTTDYNIIVDSLSNHFKFNNTAHSGGFEIKYKNKKINFTVGSGVGTINYKLKDVEVNIERSVNFNSYLPYLRLELTPKKQTALEFTYSGKTNNPTLNQIQPLINNNDPLNTTKGNPFLKQEYVHNFNWRFSDYKVIKSKSIWLYANLSLSENAITSANSYDAKTGKNIRQYVNVDGNYNFSMYSSYRFELLPSFNLYVGFNPSASRYSNFVNDVKNVSDNNNYRFSIGTSYWGEKWINYNLDFSPTYTVSKSTINPNNTKYWKYSIDGGVDMKFKKKKLYVNVDANANFYQKNETFANTPNTYVVSAGIKKSIDKKENWQAKIFVNDIFNTNNNIDRNTMSNYISQSTKQVVQRYVMFSIIYNFNKNGASN